MAEWKKIIVSGSDISQLNNDSGYLIVTDTIDSASVATRATTLSPDATASFADLASDARTADSASVAARATLLSPDATASFADLASDARTADSASVAARATTLSSEATASQADDATTASFAESGDGLFSGSFSGSFEGDGSGLTGLATNLTVDGDTGTEDVDLLADDLQILGTSEEIETAVTKVGNDVRVTLGLPDSITVTASLASNAESASVAARATELSPDATASFADLASDARTADSASVAARATELSPDATASFADRATTASFADTAGTSRNADSASVAARATELSADATASFADLASDARTADSASVAARATTLSDLATASFADLASDARTADSASVAARATTLSTDATASFADLASTVHDGNITTAKIADGDVTNAKLENDSITFGSTAQALGTTVSTLSGLDLISATTGTFVLQVYESSSTIITSGSNIFGNDQNDIQQITGSLKQTGSFTLSGSLLQSNGTISGSFEGDGSALTGITADSADSASVAARATTLSADATASFADLASDARTADSASVAARATTLSDAATASFADLASDARTADSASVAARATELSADATASFADLASDARTADSASVAARATELSADATASFADSATTASIADELSQLATASFAITASHALNVPDTASHALTAVTASIADELSGLATASIADTATSASQAENATSASATIAGNLFPTTQGLEGQTIALDSSGDFIYADLDGTGSTKKLNQTVAAQTWSFAHNLAELYPIIQVYDSEDNQLIPERVEAVDANNAKLYFATNTSGVAAAMVGGMGITASLAITADTASVATRANGLAPTVTASFADRATSASIADELSQLATASFADRATSASIADELSQLATASQADSATTASHALGGAGDFSGSFIGDGSGLTGVAGDFNFQGDSGATTINLLTETASFLGTANEIVTAVTDDTLTISLPDDVTIGNDLTVTTDLSVNGDAVIAGDLTVGGSLVSASSLEVADQFIILASGSTSAIDGGIIVNQTADADGKGQAFAYDASADRWALETGLNDTASAITPDAFMGVIQEGTSTPVGGADPIYGGTNGNGTIFVDTNNNEAYIYI